MFLVRLFYRQKIYPDENHSLQRVIEHEHQTMEAFLDDVYGPIEDYFENDYYLAAAKLLEKYQKWISGSEHSCNCFQSETCQNSWC